MYKALICFLFGHRDGIKVELPWDDDEMRTVQVQCSRCNAILASWRECHENRINRENFELRLRSRILG